MTAGANRMNRPSQLTRPAETAEQIAPLSAALLAHHDNPPPANPATSVAQAVIHLIEDNPALREAERILFEGAGWEVRDHYSAEAFLATPRPTGDACLVVDVMLPGMDGVALLELLRAEDFRVPAIMLTGRGDAATAVGALKAGAADFIEKPADWTMLLAAVTVAMEGARDIRARDHARAQAKARFDLITPREHDVMMMVLDGKPNKIIAADLGINQRTVENHRASVMTKTGAASLPALVKLFLEASGSE